MRAFYIIIFLTFISFMGFSQTVVFEEEVDTVQPLRTNNFGKNSKHYFQNYLAGGLCFGDNNIMLENKWTSRFFKYGFRYKGKLNKAEALIIDVDYLLERNIFDTESGNSLFASMKKGNMTFHNIQLSLGHRFNFDWNRGNVIGVYFDLSLYGGYALAARFNYQVEVDEILGKVKQSRLPFNSRINYGLQARLGYNKWAIFCQMALQNKSLNYEQNEIWVFNGYYAQPISVGIEFSFN